MSFTGRRGVLGGLWRTSVDSHLERVKGIEPSYEAWEAAVLPLNYTRILQLVDVNESSAQVADSTDRGRPVSHSDDEPQSEEHKQIRRYQELSELFGHVRSPVKWTAGAACLPVLGQSVSP